MDIVHIGHKVQVQVQVQTLSDATPPIGKIHHISRNFLTSYAIQMPFKIKKLQKYCNIVYFMTESTIFNHYDVAAP